jgi:Arc/MetJ family transcription regulator
MRLSRCDRRQASKEGAIHGHTDAQSQSRVKRSERQGFARYRCQPAGLNGLNTSRSFISVPVCPCHLASPGVSLKHREPGKRDPTLRLSVLGQSDHTTVHVLYTKRVYNTCMSRVRTNIEIDDTYVQIIMERYGLRTKTEAVDLALRHLAGQPMTRDEALAMRGARAIGRIPADTGPLRAR